MHITNNRLLKTIYTGLLAGMPSFTFNPINRVNLLAPLTVEKYSTYSVSYTHLTLPTKA